MRIAFINELYGTKRQGGEQEAMMSLAEQVRKIKDFEVDVYSYTGLHSNKLEFNWPDRLKLTPYLREITAAPALGKLVASRIAPRYDLIHTSSTTLFGKVECPVPLVYSLHSIRSQKSKNLSRISRYRLVFNPLVKNRLRHLEKKSLEQARKITVLHERMSKFLISQFSINPECIVNIPNPVDNEKFTPSDKPGSEVLFVGRGTEAKGVDVLIAAAPKIHGLVKIVTKTMRPGLRKQCREAGINVVFDVPHDQMPDLYRSAAVLVLPSVDEEQPLTILEAMASSLPVVATPISASELITDGEHGLVIPYNNPQALARAVNELLDNPAQSLLMGQNGRRQALSSHSWVNTLDQYIKLYQGLF
ncbi:MAG: glycosyltransferase family 4 protein [bacterium]